MLGSGYGASAASFPNSSGGMARTVVVRALPDDVSETANLVMASPFGISTVRTTSYWPVVTYALTSRPPNLAMRALLASYRFGASLTPRAPWSVQLRKHMNVGMEHLPCSEPAPTGAGLLVALDRARHGRIAPHRAPCTLLACQRQPRR